MKRRAKNVPDGALRVAMERLLEQHGYEAVMRMSIDVEMERIGQALQKLPAKGAPWPSNVIPFPRRD